MKRGGVFGALLKVEPEIPGLSHAQKVLCCKKKKIIYLPVFNKTEVIRGPAEQTPKSASDGLMSVHLRWTGRRSKRLSN